ncbi:MAG: MBL fold metallo-hydrolase [Candidatus Lokiarchaeota archaeon]|nr:MBL fold metallo-hydrolase [Candidatus Lokiarchaeota archaeon]
MKIEWIDHSCFKINISGKTIYCDPYKIPNNPEKADIILISHEHYDHYDKESVGKIKKSTSKIVCPASCEKILTNEKAKGIEPFETIEIEGITIQGVPAYNPNKKFHPKGNKWLGFIVDNGETRIYHAGDTDFIPEMKDLKGINIAFLPVGDTYTMDFHEAIKAANVIKPNMVVPMHNWDKDLNEFKELMKKDAPDIGVIVLKQKKPIEI